MENFVKIRLKKLLSFTGILFGLLFAVALLGNYVVMPLYVTSKEIVQVPDLMSLQGDEAESRLRALGLDPVVTIGPFDPKARANTVYFQSPVAGTDVKYGRHVYITITASEPKNVVVPAMKDKSEREAIILLEKSRLKKGGVIYQNSENYPENVVIAQSIPAGKEVHEGTMITLTVSRGVVKTFVEVPELINLSMNEAQKQLVKQGLSLGVVSKKYSEDWLPNTVIDQFPKAGEKAAVGRPVDLWVVTKNKSEETQNGIIRD